MYRKISRRVAITLAFALATTAVGGAAARASVRPRVDPGAGPSGVIFLDSTDNTPSNGYWASGVHQITISGTFATTRGYVVDAGCYQPVSPSGAGTWTPWPGLVSYYSQGPIGPIAWTAKSPDANGCDPQHVYTATVTVTDNVYHYAPAIFKLNNNYYATSTGWLVVEAAKSAS